MEHAERLVRWCVARTDLRGSDVRLCSGDLVRPHHVSRQSSEPHLWRWRTTMSWAWKRSDAHINELESLAVLMELRRRSRSTRNFDCTYLHLVDSQVAIGVFSKRRSSSRLLQRVLRRANALCLASGLHPVYVYVRSELNPADRPSRRFDHINGQNAPNKLTQNGSGTGQARAHFWRGKFQRDAKVATKRQLLISFGYYRSLGGGGLHSGHDETRPSATFSRGCGQRARPRVAQRTRSLACSGSMGSEASSQAPGGATRPGTALRSRLRLLRFRWRRFLLCADWLSAQSNCSWPLCFTSGSTAFCAPAR